MKIDFTHCTLCPRVCGADRTKTQGYCGTGNQVRVAKAMLHKFEEPVISGTRGSGAVFFSGCALRCGYCQNREISFCASGQEVSTDALAEIFLALQVQGAHNLNLVTAAHFLPQVAQALRQVKPIIKIPVVYNTSAYEKPEALRLLSGLIDVYLPDYKYSSSVLAQKYSLAPDYPQVAAEAIEEMLLQVGTPVFGADGLIKRGVIVRHLVLPASRKDSLAAIETIAKRFKGAYVSLMWQYTPAFNNTGDKNLNRKVTGFEYNSVLNYAVSLGLKGFMQERGSAKADYKPDFTKE